MNKPVIAVSMGDPAGIGPEICLRAIREPAVLDICQPVIYGDIDVLQKVAGICRITIADTSVINHISDCNIETLTPGCIQKQCGQASYAYIKSATTDTLNGKASAMTTAPIHKEAMHLAGIPHPGHTEILAELTGAKHICMTMASDKIIVSLATIHISLSQVPAQLTTEKIYTAITLTNSTLKKLGKPSPRITVCALNPHAGENGLFGTEEQTIIMPAIEKARHAGIAIEGPVPPDTAFITSRLENTDAYIVMYHDQGLIPFKMIAFDEGVNITLGLPIVRTSVDHGTAYDIAWQGKASHTSMVQAIIWAARLG